MARTPKPMIPTPFRFRISVPVADTDVLNWLNLQSNASQSVRDLIKACIRAYGMCDVTCLKANVRPEIEIQPNTGQEMPVIKSKPVAQSHPTQAPAAPVQSAPTMPQPTQQSPVYDTGDLLSGL